MERLEKVARPDEVLMVKVPERVPDPALNPKAMAIVAVTPERVLPKVSFIMTTTAGERELPAVPLLGC